LGDATVFAGLFECFAERDCLWGSGCSAHFASPFMILLKRS
jgi:hypothetical protein